MKEAREAGGEYKTVISMRVDTRLWHVVSYFDCREMKRAYAERVRPPDDGAADIEFALS